MRDEFRPGRMLKRHEAHIAAELFENVALFKALAVFTERDEIDGVLACKFAQQMKRALVGAAVDGVWDVRIDDEDVHGDEVAMMASAVEKRIARK